MALLDNILFSPGEPIQDMYDKINAAIDAINNALAGDSYKIKIVQIGDWDMDTTSTAIILHGISDFTKIRSITASIRNDVDGAIYNLCIADPSTFVLDGSVDYANTTQLVLSRRSGGAFDNSNFNSTSFNRGWVTIIYTS